MDEETRAQVDTLKRWIDALRSAEGFYPGAEGFRIGSTRLFEKLVSHAEHDDEYHLHQRDEDGTETDLTGARSIQGIPVSETDPTTTQILGYNATINEWAPTAAGAAAAHEAAHRSGGADELSHDNLAGVSADDHHAQSHNVASHSDTTATGTELETLTDGSDADALHDHTQFASAAEAISAVEGEATLDLTGDVTIAATKSLAVDTIGEKTGAAGVTIDTAKLKDSKVYPVAGDANMYFGKIGGNFFLQADTGDFIHYNVSLNKWYFYSGDAQRFTVSPTTITSALNHDFSAGIDVTGDITVTGTVDGVDIAARDHAEAHSVASHDDTTATGTELETLTDGSDADALHDHATLATAAEAVTAVEAANPLDMTNAIQVDDINEHTATDGVTIDASAGAGQGTWIVDNKVYPRKDLTNAYIVVNVAGDMTFVFDTGDGFTYDVSANLWTLSIGAAWKFKVDGGNSKAELAYALDMNSHKITELTAGSASGEAVEYDQLHAEAHSVASHNDTTITGAETETLSDGSDASSLHVHSKTVIFKVLAHDTALTTGDNKEEWTVPLALNGWNLTDADAAVYTASSAGGNAAVGPIQIYNETQTADMLSTGITLDQDEFNSYTANTQPVIDTGEDDVATGDILSFDVDTAAGTGTKGLDIIMVFTKP